MSRNNNLNAIQAAKTTFAPIGSRLVTTPLTKDTDYAYLTDLKAYQPVGSYALKDDLKAYQPAGAYALKNDLTGFASKTDLTGYASKTELSKFQLVGSYALKDDLKAYQPAGAYALKNDLTGFALKSELPVGQDLSKYASKTDLTGFASKTDLTKFQPVGSYALKDDLKSYQPTGNYALKSDIPDVTKFQPVGNYALKSDIPVGQDLSKYALASHTHAEFALKSDLTGLASKTELNKFQATGNYALKSDIPDVTKFQTIGDYALKSDLKAYQPVGAVTGSTTGTRFKVRDEGNGITINTDGAPAGQARMHVMSEDELYVLNKKGMIVGKEWGGNGNLNVQGKTNTGILSVGADAPGDWRGANFVRRDGRWSHFDWKDDGKNYIRGDTVVDGNTNFNGNVDINGNFTVKGQPVGAVTGGVTGAGSGINFTSKWGGTPDGVQNISEISNDTTGFKKLMIVGNKSGGADRRVGVWDQLDVHGKLNADGEFRAVNGYFKAEPGSVQVGANQKNSWILHAPNDDRNTFFLAPGTDGGNWDWSKQMTINKAGDVNINGKGRVSNINFTSQWGGTPDGVQNISEISNDTTGFKTLMIVGNKSAGAERRVGVWDRLDVNGKLCVEGVCINGATLASFIKNNDPITLKSNKSGAPVKRLQRSADEVGRFTNENRGDWESMTIERL